MAPITQLVLSLLQFSGVLPKNNHPLGLSEAKGEKKSIAIIGAGTAGLATLKTIFDLPKEVTANWDVVVFEKRWDVGGVW
jgi:NADPH-dependent glutamate synthase beta subunit-like oxidoreductase